jgi:DNA-binding CsgD family transcriptional regulator
MLDHLQHGRQCYERRAWSDAYHALLSADQAMPLEVDDLDRLATAAYLSGRVTEFHQYLGRLHRAHVEAGQRPRAARCAFWLGLTLLFQGEVGQANAWTARGQRLIEGLDCVEQGYLLLPIGEQQLREGKVDAGCQTSESAVAIGEAFGDADLVAAARHGVGRALIQKGDVPAGLRCLDETMLAVVAGELSPILTGLMYCSVIEACREVCELGRAREWTFALSGWCDEQPDIVFTGVCLVHRAEIMRFHGAWTDAMTEACRACERSVRAERRPPAAALYQQGEIHRLRGEFAKAEDLFREASRLGYEPQPGLALLRLAQGRTDAAAAAMRRIMSATTDRLGRVRLLPAHFDVMLATGDLDEARRALLELRALAETFDTEVLRALAAQAEGAIRLAEGDARAALGPLAAAFDAWQRLEAPYEAACVRTLIALSARALGDHDAAALELDAAKAAFDQLGAAHDRDRLEALDRPHPPQDGHTLTPRELQVLRLVVAGRTNKAIAETLSVSERTIDRHVSNILDKFAVPSRAAATAYAYDHKLL